jgi:hypothetical protein
MGALSAQEFIDRVNGHLSSTVDQERTLLAEFSSGFSPGPGRGSIAINFINLPKERHRQRRGGGAEAENNRQLFMVWGFDQSINSPVARIKLEQSVNGIGARGAWAPKLRARTGEPDKIALYFAKYVNQIAESFPPNYTHDGRGELED